MPSPIVNLLAILLIGCAGDISSAAIDDAGALPSDAPIASPRDAAISPRPPDLHDDPCSTITCGAGAHCDSGACVCDIGWTLMGGACQMTPIGDPAQRTQSDVCTQWRTTAVGTSNFFSKSSMMCDPGALSSAGLMDAVRRIDFFRWFVGLGPVSIDATLDADAQACALLCAWNAVGPQAHSPPPTSTCYTSAGAAGAGMGNIAWGSGTPVAAIDQWIVDSGNETTLGHRRWILNPPLNPIGFGLYVGGNNYGSAACLEVFGMSGTGPHPDWQSFPPPGFVPIDVTQWTWSFTSNQLDYSTVQVAITRVSDNKSLPVTMIPLSNPGGGNYENAISWQPSGWAASAGEQYHVVVSDSKKSFPYDVKPVSCP